MSGSDRHERNTAGLVALALLGLALVIIGLGFGLLKQSEYQWEAKENTRKYTAYTYAPKRDACFVSSLIDRQDCLGKAYHEARANEREEQDLVAQRVTATWTLLMGCAAILGMSLSILGVFLVWTTFQATRDSNLIAREIGEAQVRAYLSLDFATFDIGVNVITLKLGVKNSGSSPAKNVRVVSKFRGAITSPYRSEDESIQGLSLTVIEMKPYTNVLNDIQAGHTLTGKFSSSDSDFQGFCTSVKNQIRSFNCLMTIKWKDVFGKEQDLFVQLFAADDGSIGDGIVTSGKFRIESEADRTQRDTPYPNSVES